MSQYIKYRFAPKRAAPDDIDITAVAINAKGPFGQMVKKKTAKQVVIKRQFTNRKTENVLSGSDLNQ